MKRYNKSIYADDGIFYTCCGTRVVDEYQLDYRDTGGVCLKKIGEKPLYDIIQSNRANCDLDAVLSSVVHNNQHDVIPMDSVSDLVADFTTSSNLGELYAHTKKMENLWEQMPIDVREKFGSDIRQFIHGIGTPDFYSKIADGYTSFSNSFSQRTFVNDTDSVVPPVVNDNETTVQITPPSATESEVI